MLEHISQIENLLYLAVGVSGFLIFGRHLKRRFHQPLRPSIWIAVGMLLVLGVLFAELVSEREKRQVRRMLEGFVPTYAVGMQRLGHELVTLKTPPDDPVYLRLIRVQIDWLKANRAVADIYTFRKLPDGQIALIVDSETDYDRDGEFNDERESRTAIGEIYEKVTPQMERAFAGEVLFDPEPVTDRWGTWVSAYAPIYGKDGRVDAVLGVDYYARDFLRAYHQARFVVFAIDFLLLILVALIAWILAYFKWSMAEHSKVQAQLLHSAKLASIGTLAAGVAHEINNPLAIIKGYLGILRNSIQDPELRETVEKQDKAVERIARIVNSLRTFARPDTEAVESLDLNKILVDTIGLVAPIFAKHKISIESRLADQPAMIRANIGKIQQVVMNFLTNARDAMEGLTVPGRILVETIDREGKVELRVSDNGAGIDDGTLARIFDPFFTTKPAGKGTGLGLSICRNIITSFGGTISVESIVGVGTTFRVELPGLAAMAAGKPVAAPAPQVITGLSGRALVVDDEEEIRYLLKRYLLEMGMEVSEARDGQEALEKLGGERFELVITDVKMDRLNGCELLLKARELLSAAKTAFVVITGGVVTEYSKEQREVIRNFAQGYLKKPFDKETLSTLLAKVLRS